MIGETAIAVYSKGSLAVNVQVMRFISVLCMCMSLFCMSMQGGMLARQCALTLRTIQDKQLTGC